MNTSNLYRCQVCGKLAVRRLALDICREAGEATCVVVATLLVCLLSVGVVAGLVKLFSPFCG